MNSDYLRHQRNGARLFFIVFLPAPTHTDKPALLIELKYNYDTKTAYEQIIQNNYPDRLEKYRTNLLLVGINYSKDLTSKNSKFKHHTCKIVKAK